MPFLQDKKLFKFGWDFTDLFYNNDQLHFAIVKMLGLYDIWTKFH